VKLREFTGRCGSEHTADQWTRMEAGVSRHTDPAAQHLQYATSHSTFYMSIFPANPLTAVQGKLASKNRK